MSRSIGDLCPDARAMAERFLDRCEEDPHLRNGGVEVLVTCTYRSNEEQAALYAQGRTKPGRIVTRAKPGQSAHNAVDANGKPASRAIDIVPTRYGKALWGTSGDGIDDDPSDDRTDDLEAWQRIGKIGEDCGFNWYGRPDAPFREFPHFELKLR